MNNVMNNLILSISSVFKAEKVLPSKLEKQFQKELLNNYDLYRSVVEHSFGAVVVTDLTGKIIYVNCPLEIALGTKASNLKGKNFYTILEGIDSAAPQSSSSLNSVLDLKNKFKEYNGEIISLDNLGLAFSQAKLYTRLIYEQAGNAQGIFWFWKDESYYPSRLMKEIAKMCISSISSNTLINKCAKVVSCLDWDTRIHSHQVIRYAGIIADAIGMTEDEKYNLGAAALLHDIGKIKIPKNILNKPGRLTNKEYSLIKKHPEIGSRLVKDIPLTRNFSNYILYHHERFDGGGYPAGLAGCSIPLYSRIIAIADSFDAMLSTRPYKKQLSFDDAISELIKCSGSQFDPELVDIFINYCCLEPSGLNNTTSFSSHYYECKY